MKLLQSTKRYISIMLTALFMLTSLASIQAQASTPWWVLMNSLLKRS